jgi:hypothetical protein
MVAASVSLMPDLGQGPLDDLAELVTLRGSQPDVKVWLRQQT